MSNKNGKKLELSSKKCNIGYRKKVLYDFGIISQFSEKLKVIQLGF